MAFHRRIDLASGTTITEAATAQLAAYNVTRIPAGHLRSGLIARNQQRNLGAERAISTLDAAPVARPALRLVASDDTAAARATRPARTERRQAERTAVSLPAAADDVSGATLTGSVVDVSPRGIRLVMDGSPADPHVEIVVEGATACSVVWGKVIAHETVDGEHCWHVLILTADDAWDNVLRDATTHAVQAN